MVNVWKTIRRAPKDLSDPSVAVPLAAPAPADA